MKNIRHWSIVFVGLLAVACTGIFTDRELPSLDARTDIHQDGADGESEVPGCAPGQVLCGGVCVDPRTDRNNCGACGSRCDPLASCVEGTCVCPGDRTDCGGVCVDIDTDNHNCGRCGNVCGPDQVCNGSGICTTECVSGYTLCDPGSDAYCADTRSDPFNCGGCHNMCGPYERAISVCSAGECGKECDSGYGDADGQIDNGCECTITGATETCDSVDNNCDGSIDEGFPCAPGVTESCTPPPPDHNCPGTRTCGPDCTWGTCTDTCGGSEPYCCSDGCTNISSDPENCGSCGNSCGGRLCCIADCRECCGDGDCYDDDHCTQDICNSSGICEHPLSPEMTPCTGGGLCCSGECIPVAEGECCTDADCPSRCGERTPVACSDFTEADCGVVREGCSWSPAQCTGSSDPCPALDPFFCTPCGCTWSSGTCSNTSGTSCAFYITEVGCNECGDVNCTWQPASCSGTPTPCDSYGNAEACIAQQGCGWTRGTCQVYHCI